jgi:hypothetical protein
LVNSRILGLSFNEAGVLIHVDTGGAPEKEKAEAEPVSV